MPDEKQATPGAEFFDTKYSPVKFIECVDLPGKLDWKADPETGDLVNIGGGNGKVYGPYRLTKEIAKGNGKLVFMAYAIGSKGNLTKPLTKLELEQQNAALLARLAKLEADQEAATKSFHEAAERGEVAPDVPITKKQQSK